MLLEILFKKYNFAIETIVVRENHNLGITSDEAWVLMALFKASVNKEEFSLESIDSLVENKDIDVQKALYSLLKKEFFKLDLIQDDKGKEKEVVNMEPAFSKIEKMILDQSKAKRKKPTKKVLAILVEDLESMFGRNLSSNEIETVNGWFAREEFAVDDVSQAITNVASKPNPTIFKVEREIRTLSKIPVKEKVDPDKEKQIQKLYGSIKK